MLDFYKMSLFIQKIIIYQVFSFQLILKKAFDPLNWIFLFKTLENVNFGENFINNVKPMYNCIESTILNNGSLSKLFKLQQRVRQGCPLSAYLFILALETLATKSDQIKI